MQFWAQPPVSYVYLHQASNYLKILYLTSRNCLTFTEAISCKPNKPLILLVRLKKQLLQMQLGHQQTTEHKSHLQLSLWVVQKSQSGEDNTNLLEAATQHHLLQQPIPWSLYYFSFSILLYGSHQIPLWCNSIKHRLES